MKFKTRVSNNLVICDCIEIGLYLEIMEWLPYLGIGVIELIFSMDGNIPLSSLKRDKRGYEIIIYV